MFDPERSGWTWDDVMDLLEVRQFKMLALRVAASAAGNPRQCRMEACHKTGRCHLVLRPGEEEPCRVGVTQEIIEHAALMFVFLVHFMRVHMLAEPWTPYSDDRCWSTRPKHKRRKKDAAIPSREEQPQSIGPKSAKRFSKKSDA